MRSIWIILLVLTGVAQSLSVHAQESIERARAKKKDSYYDVKSRASASDIQRLLSDAEKNKTKNPKAALENVQEALAMSIAEEDDFNEGRSYLLLAEINENIQEWKLAFDNYQQAYQKLTANRPEERKSSSKESSYKLSSAATSGSAEFKKALTGLGHTSFRLGQFDEALKHYRELLTQPLNLVEKAECQLSISEVYYGMKNYDEALKILNEIQYSSKSGNSSVEIRIKNQQAKIYVQQNLFDKAQNSYNSNVQNFRSAENAGAPASGAVQKSTQQAKEEIATALKDQGKFDDEINLRRQAIQYNLETENLPEVSRDKVAISESFAAKGEIPEAIREAEEAAAIADTIDNPKEQANAYLALADLYEKNKNNSKAITAYKKYSQAVIKNEKFNQLRLTDKSELLDKQKDIEELSRTVSIGQREDTIQQQTVFRQQLIIYGLIAIILIVAVAAYFTYRSAQASKTANQLLALKSLRSQMNPHFIFNALNSVNHFVAQQDERTANKFLSEFSQLMRLVLENSQEDFIPLYKEQEILSLYLKLEHYRFRDKFDYQINIDEDISTESVEVPPMLIQPYIENAVWHGLRYKEAKGRLLLNIYVENGFLVVEIIDDGIGRKKSAELKTANQKKHTSTGLKNIQERLLIINKVYKTNYRVDINDLTTEGGTRVRIYLPITKTLAA